MNYSRAILSVLLLLLTNATATSPIPLRMRNSRCGPTCAFTICGFRRAILSHPRLPITRPICSRVGKPIGNILSVGEALITPHKKKRTIPISSLRFNGTTPYTKRFFYPIRSDVTVPNVSSIAVRFLPRPALQRLHLACVKVPITRWIERGVERTGRGCAAFRVEVPTVMVELTWDTNDDLDLFVVEPDGTSVFFQGGGGNGHLLRDVGRKRCNKVRRVGGKETIVYYANEVVKPGRYFVSAEHTKSCLEGPTGWEIRVVIRGRLLRRFNGVSRLREGGVMPGSAVSFFVP